MSNLSVRQAIFSDIEELSELFDQYRVFQGRVSDLSAARSFLQAWFDHGESVVFIEHEDTAPLGFAQLYPSYSSTSLSRIFILNDLFVQENGRRKGVASKLLAALEGYAWSHGAARVTLNVARDNELGQSLYEAQGWRKDAQFFVYHRYPRSHWVVHRHVGPNPSLKRSTNGRPPGPVWWYAYIFTSPGLASYRRRPA